MIPYGRQSINEDDIRAVERVLRSDRLTQGPEVAAFEEALASYCGARFAVVAANGTAALHAAYHAAGIGESDEIITSAMTFVATANAALYLGAKSVFADIDPSSGAIDPRLIEAAITDRTKAIVPIHYMGRPAEFDGISAIAKKNNLLVIEDGCQALGADYKGRKIGNLGDMTVFSFHPVKSITTGEGGAVLTNDEILYKKMKRFITHGIAKENFTYESHGPWYIEQQVLGYNYRLTDVQCALGKSQLGRLDQFIAKRKQLAARYDSAFVNAKNFVLPPKDTSDVRSAWHLYVIRLKDRCIRTDFL